MRNNETGEFELVVGNRQLLSGFFMVVLLFAVAFAMGYVVGENSRSAKAQAEVAGTGTPGATTPGLTQGEARPQPASAVAANPPAATPAQGDAPQQTPAETTPQPTTQPAREVPSATREVPPPQREVPRPKREAPPPDRETKTAPAAAAPSAPPAEGPAGSYWQVLATANHDSAQNMLQSLRDKGLPASLSPGPNNLTRVLVGPYGDTASLGRAKTELEAAGFRPVRR
jgi:cell division septation protein DedD